MTQPAAGIGGFAPPLTPHTDNLDALTRWITQVRAADPPHQHAFNRDRDIDAAIAGLTPPYSNGATEGVNTKTKRIARQVHGRADFTLLRHRILLGQQPAPSPPNARQGRSFNSPATSSRAKA